MRALIVENEKITNIIDVEKLSDWTGAVADDGGQIGWDYKDGSSSNPNPEPTIDKAAEARFKRDLLLQECDWTQVADKAGLSDSKLNEWVTYRQSLRDVPAQSGFPDSITWPSKPS
tara:strand:- start:9 stop:356 length:348 start_codon:yes stop_codon:yes gene_type:complete